MTRDPGARRALPVVVVSTGLGVLTFAVIGPALPDLATALGVSRGAIGMIQGAVAIPGIFLAVFIGYAADLRGRRFVLGVSLLVFGAAGLAGYWVHSFWPLVGLRAVQGIGTSGLLSLGVVVIGDLFHGDQRRWAIGINAAGITVTAMVAPIIGGVLAAGDPFRPFLVFALALGVLPFVRLLPGPPIDESVAPPFGHFEEMIRELRRLGKLSDFAGLLPFSLLAMVLFVGFGFTTTPLFLEAEFALSSSERGFMQAVLSVGSSWASLRAVRWVMRTSPRFVLTLALAGLVAGFVTLAAAPSLWVVGGGLLVLGVALGALFPVIQEFVASAVPTTYRGVAVGTWLSSIRLGQAVGPVLASSMADGVGERASYATAAIALALMGVVWQPLRALAGRGLRRRGRTPPLG